jgi:hypothetical protein
MEAFLLEHESLIWAGAFYGAFALAALWELAPPQRALTSAKAVRWFGNFCLAILNSIVTPWVMAGLAIAVAIVAGEHDVGLLNNVDLPL